MMGNRTLEYDNHKGFRCQRCEEWTLGGRLYSSGNNERVCFLCHMEDVSDEMLKDIKGREETLDNSTIGEDLTPTRLDEKIPVAIASERKGSGQKDTTQMSNNVWDADLI